MNGIPPRPVLLAGVLLASLLVCGVARSAILIEGVSNETVYNDTASFRVESEAGFSYVATLNGKSVPVGVFVPIEEARFYELEVTKTNEATMAEESSTVRFIVRSSSRGSSENGIATWVPKPEVDSAPSALASGQLSVVAPAVFPIGRKVPVAASLKDSGGEPLWLHGKIHGERFPGGLLQLLRGAGGALLEGGSATGADAIAGNWAGGAVSRAVTYEAEPAWTEVSGALAGSVAWGANARVRVTGNLAVPAGERLTIGSGSIVCLEPGVDVRVDGEIVINGSVEAPCVWCPAVGGGAWGGFLLTGAGSRVEATGTFFTGSGEDGNWFNNNSGFSTHRDEQALFLLDNDSTCVLTDCWMIDNEGQIGNGSSGSSLTMTRCLVQRALTLGQYNSGCTVTIDRCHLLEFPVNSDEYDDGDNDVAYLSGSTAVLTRTVLGWTKDDGIDAGGSGAGNVMVTDCWIESCFHEGLALSGANKVIGLTRGVVVNCGQAVECGYDGPLVTVRDSLLAGNVTGARYGDNYDWDYGGLLDVQDSFLLGNERDIFEWEWDTWTAHGSDTAVVEVVNNKVTISNPLHPANTRWDPAREGGLLASLVPAVTWPGGVAVEGPWQRDVSEYGSSVKIRMSEVRAVPATGTFAIYGQESPGGAETELGSGTFEIPAGFLEVDLVLPGLDLSGFGFARLTVTAGTGAEFSGRDSVYFVPGVVPQPPVTLIPTGAMWRYHDLAQDLGTAWKEIGYNDSAWVLDDAEFGFGDRDEATVIDGGADGARTPTVYFRRTFQVPDPSAFASLFLRLKRDDGAIVWINGEELTRENLPPSGVTYATYTGSATGTENAFFESAHPSGILRAGENTIAVEVHQAGVGSSDMSFDMELIGQAASPFKLNLTAAGGKLVMWWLDPDASLEQSETLRPGEWTPSAGASPQEDALEAARRFFRLVK